MTAAAAVAILLIAVTVKMSMVASRPNVRLINSSPGGQASNRKGGVKEDGDLGVSCIPFCTVFINSRVGLQYPNRMKGGEDADDFSGSRLLFYTILLTPGRLFRTLHLFF